MQQFNIVLQKRFKYFYLIKTLMTLPAAKTIFSDFFTANPFSIDLPKIVIPAMTPLTRALTKIAKLGSLYSPIIFITILAPAAPDKASRR